MTSRQSARRLATGLRAAGQGLLGVALIALAALVFLPSVHGAPVQALPSLQAR